ncbi:MAG: membrane protein insertase YidC [Bryobacteraceae bacterium]
MELRLLIAFVLMGVVMFTMPYFYKSVAPPQAAKKAAPAAAQQPSPQAPEAAEVKPAPPPPAPAPAAPVAAQKEDLFFLDTNLYHITFSNRGGVVTSWLLKKYKTHAGKPLELVNTAARTARPMSFHFDKQKPSVDLNQALFAARPDPDGLGITYEYSNGQVYAKKTLRFKKDSYLSEVSSQVTENGKYIPALLAWRGGFGDLAVVNPASAQQTLYYDTASGRLEKQAAKAAKDGPVTSTGAYSFAGIEDTYFAAAFLPEGTATVQQVTFSDNARTVLQEKEEAFAGVAVGNGGANRFALFVGPKDVDILKAVNPKLEQIVDFGRWFGFLAKPLFLMVNWVNDHFVHNYGWAIVLVTIGLNFALFPLRFSNMKSMKKMQALQPQIKAINDKYKGIGMRDPRKTQQNQEVMDLYKRYGVNPMGGCVPMLIQIPFFIAFYSVFSVAVEMRMASWLWVTDLSQPEQLPIKILPIAMIVSQFFMQKMTPSTGMDPNQQRMMLIMPLVFGFMFYNFSSGLVLYYLTSNLVMIAQQWFFNRTSVAEALARSVQVAPKKRNGKK